MCKYCPPNPVKTPRSIAEVRKTMRLSTVPGESKVVHKCQDSKCRPGKWHQCSFEGCRHRTKAPSNLSVHEMSMHVPRELWRRCTWPNCQFRYSDGSSYNKHKTREHAYKAEPRKERDPSTYYSKNKRRRHADREESVDSELYDPPQGSSLWPSTRHFSPGSDASDASYYSNAPSTTYASSSSLLDSSADSRGSYFSTALPPYDAGKLVSPLQPNLGCATYPYYSAPWNAAPAAGWAPNGTYSYTAPATSVSSFGNYLIPGLVDDSSQATLVDQMMASPPSSGASFYDSVNMNTTKLDFSEPTIAEILAELAEIEEHLRL